MACARWWKILVALGLVLPAGSLRGRVRSCVLGRRSGAPRHDRDPRAYAPSGATPPHRRHAAPSDHADRDDDRGGPRGGHADPCTTSATTTGATAVAADNSGGHGSERRERLGRRVRAVRARSATTARRWWPRLSRPRPAPTPDRHGRASPYASASPPPSRSSLLVALTAAGLIVYVIESQRIDAGQRPGRPADRRAHRAPDGRATPPPSSRTPGWTRCSTASCRARCPDDNEILVALVDGETRYVSASGTDEAYRRSQEFRTTVAALRRRPTTAPSRADPAYGDEMVTARRCGARGRPEP